MKLNIGPIEVAVRRLDHDYSGSASVDSEPMQSFFRNPNIDAPTQQANLSSVVVEVGEGYVELAAETLQANGIVAIPNFLEIEHSHIAAAEIESFVAAYQPVINAQIETVVDGTEFIFDDTRDYQSLRMNHRPVLVRRSRADLGMLDMFNADRVFPSLRAFVLPAFVSQDLRQILQLATGIEWHHQNLNVYRNSGVVQTRGFHVDSYGHAQIKAFIYLSDVANTSEGPYAYILGSHQESFWKRLNQKLVRGESVFHDTDTPYVDQAKMALVFGSAGTLIISRQDGFHRGIAQTESGKRLMAVMNFSTSA